MNKYENEMAKTEVCMEYMTAKEDFILTNDK